MIADFLDMLVGGIFDFLGGFFSIFPQMPVSANDLNAYMDGGIVTTVLSWMNYFLPLDVASGIVALWATGMMAYVGLKLAMKYTGEIK